MPKLKNAKRERFCQEFMVDQNATKAAERATYKCPNVKGSQLKSYAEVVNRIAELQAEAAERNEVTVDSIAKQLDDDRELARTEKQCSAAVQASVHKGKLHGMFKEGQDDRDGIDTDAVIRKITGGDTLAEQALRLLLSYDVSGFHELVQPRRMDA